MLSWGCHSSGMWRIIFHHHHHISFIELGHLLTRSGLTYPEVSSKVYHDSFCQLGSSVSLPWVIYFEAFYLHVVSSFSCIPVICPKLVLFLTPLQFVHLFCSLSKCTLLFFSRILEECNHQLHRCVLSCKEGVRSMDLVRYSLWACQCHKTNILTASGNKRNCLPDHTPACVTLSTSINSPPRLICNLFLSSAIFFTVPPGPVWIQTGMWIANRPWVAYVISQWGLPNISRP